MNVIGGDEMRKVLCLLLSGIIIFALCSCKNEEESAPTIQNISSIQSVISSNSPTVSVASDISESSSKPNTETSSMPVSSKETDNTKSSSENRPESPKPAESQTQNIKDPIEVLNYTVTDPQNLRGLSTKKYGFSFGVAENGKPHSQSVINQNTFDSFENVEALALDTKTAEKVMYLTFDNGYEYQNLTANILDTLKEKNVKAVFFITLSYAKSNKALVQRMINEGHIVGNHSANHPSFPNLNRTQMAEEIAKLDNFLRTQFGYTSPYFRFPSGEYSENALELVTSIGFKSVFWSVAYSDWDTSVQKGADFAFSTVTSRFHPGAVILLHAVSKDNADALGRIIDKAQEEGYSFKTLDDYFK
jgi:peptidoglycan-N-acetylmuramic acid deacetylase